MNFHKQLSNLKNFEVDVQKYFPVAGEHVLVYCDQSDSPVICCHTREHSAHCLQ